MITFSSEAQAKLMQIHIIGLLQKAKLCKSQAKEFVACHSIGDRYAVVILALQLHGYCMRYKKYKGNESLKELVEAHAIKLSNDERELLLQALNTNTHEK